MIKTKKQAIALFKKYGAVKDEYFWFKPIWKTFGEEERKILAEEITDTEIFTKERLCIDLDDIDGRTVPVKASIIDSYTYFDINLIESMEQVEGPWILDSKHVKSLGHSIIFDDDCMTVGCRNITREDADIIFSHMAEWLNYDYFDAEEEETE